MTSLESPIIAVINHLLVRQPMLCHKLRTHSGGVACLEVGAIQLKLAVAADGLFQLAETAEPNVTIRIKPADLLQVMVNMEKAFSYVTISGDADFARTISEIANELHWEPEEDLAPFLGDIARRFHKPNRVVENFSKTWLNICWKKIRHCCIAKRVRNLLQMSRSFVMM